MTNIFQEIYISPETHYILEKSFFSCSLCSHYSLNLFQTSCCEKFLCISCKNNLLNKKLDCPHCKKNDYYINFSEIAQKLLLSSILDCPLCDFNDEYENLISHLKTMHFSEIQKPEIFNKNESLFELLLVNCELVIEKKYYAHMHKVLLKPKDSNFKCYLCDKKRPMPPKKLKNDENSYFESEEKLAKNEENNLKEIENFDEKVKEKKEEKLDEDEDESLKNILLENINFKCEICNIAFCRKCIESTKIYLKSKKHEHEMKLFFGTEKWVCDSTKTENGCYSAQKNLNKSKMMIENFPRYRCKLCNFDLCEKCMIQDIQ